VANKIWLASETPLLFADTAQTEDVALTLSGLVQNTGRVSARYDLGAASRPALLEWRLHCSLNGTNIVGAAIEVYGFTSDGANEDGEVGLADATFATDKRNNAKPCGLLVVDQTTTNVIMAASGLWLCTSRYFSMGVWNATTLPFTTSTTAHGLTITPVSWEIQ
jgi:hypothetical protein